MLQFAADLFYSICFVFIWLSPVNWPEMALILPYQFLIGFGPIRLLPFSLELQIIYLSVYIPITIIEFQFKMTEINFTVAFRMWFNSIQVMFCKISASFCKSYINFNLIVAVVLTLPPGSLLSKFQLISCCSCCSSLATVRWKNQFPAAGWRHWNFQISIDIFGALTILFYWMNQNKNTRAKKTYPIHMLKESRKISTNKWLCI